VGRDPLVNDEFLGDALWLTLSAEVVGAGVSDLLTHATEGYWISVLRGRAGGKVEAGDRTRGLGRSARTSSKMML
jgi:hypothetical protein